MTVDLEGTAPQTHGPVNCGFAQTISAARVAFKLLVNPERPVDGGTFKTFTVKAPEGSISAATEPAACQWYFSPLGLLIDLIVKALAPAVPALAGMGERQEQHRDTVRERGGDAGKGGFRPGAVLHHEDARRLAVGHAGKASRHIDSDAFLTADDGADAGGDGVLDQGRRWESEERRPPLPLEDLNDGIRAPHLTFPLLFVADAQGRRCGDEGKVRN